MEGPVHADVSICQASTAEEIDGVRDLLREYLAWVLTLEADSENAPPFIGIEEELATLPGIYAPPSGRLLLAKQGLQLAGCVCLKRHDADVAEVKRLYVRPSMRGMNIGGLLVGKLVEEARSAGYRRIILDSHRSMAKAHAIYESAGFRRVAPWHDFPEHLKTVAVFMERDL